jgi:hypothetical protein
VCVCVCVCEHICVVGIRKKIFPLCVSHQARETKLFFRHTLGLDSEAQFRGTTDHKNLMTLLAALELHPYLEWADTIEMWKIKDVNCCLCAASRLFPGETTSRGGISAMLCPSCIMLAGHHNGTIPIYAALGVRDDLDKQLAVTREVVVGASEPEAKEEKTTTATTILRMVDPTSSSDIRSVRGHFSFPVNTGLLNAVRWGHETARCMGRDRELSTVQC